MDEVPEQNSELSETGVPTADASIADSATVVAPQTASATAEAAPVPLNVAGARPEIALDRGGDELNLVLGEFAGPLDLLLYLIRQEQVDIYDIPVARITNEYLRYLNMMKELDIAVAGDFLVMAATLIEIKSKMLLPRDPLAAPSDEEFIDPRAD